MSIFLDSWTPWPVQAGYSWAQPPAPEVGSWNFSSAASDKIAVNAASLRMSPPAVVAWDCGSILPQAISIALPRTKIGTRSFVFPAPLEIASPPRAASLNKTDPPSGCASTGSANPTRIKPPRDVIKLEDRLCYLLQPSLEALLSEGALGFPFRPFPYQFEGVAFLYPRHAAILADEMGLGKTMQAITAVRLLLHRGEVRNVLLVCPKPLVTNWQREFQQWAPEIPVMVVEGDQARRAWQWRLPDVPLRIANYELLCRDRELFAGEKGSGAFCRNGPPGASHKRRLTPFPRPHFDLVVLDESQRIKNRAGATNQVVRSISRRRGWALTGTPVENSTEDLVGIFEFLAPGFISADMKPRKIGRTVSDYVLRRTKDAVLGELPPKMVHDEPLELSPEQRASYTLAEEEGVVRLSELGDSVSIQHVFELVLRLKQICNFDPATGASAKLERLEADLEEIAESGRKAIVFSQWVQTLERLGERLNRFGPLQYHGKIPAKRRDEIIRRFQEDESRHVILMSYGAGGVGLNLQFANYVFLFDRWWNPAVEDQAINRAHRIGVDGPVHVTRFVTTDSIEERIDRILQEKRELFDIIFSDAETPRKLGLTHEELFGLFRLKCPTLPIDVAA
ncbi:MAG: DEAD/DEAH box helicase [Pirellulales bacterium]|nr:DEAD/DEAH box helicase [Pirellulales bacterium]